MKNPKNQFKAGLREGRSQIGIWNALTGPVVVEQLACAGFDWVLIDSEHSPLEASQVLPALQAVAAYPKCSAVVRPASNDPVLIKRMLDIGAQTLMIPFVQTAEEAQAAVTAMRYGPNGIRGFAGITRATRYGRVEGYATDAEQELCLLVQVETATALGNLETIAAVKGVDGVFIGPADLAASMGHPGQLDHPEVVAAMEEAIARLKALGMPSGILTLDTDFNKRCIELGTTFTAVGVDQALLQDAIVALAADFDRSE
jgi:4-hydroxy-2-oxoheptanedioate aldolase